MSKGTRGTNQFRRFINQRAAWLYAAIFIAVVMTGSAQQNVDTHASDELRSTIAAPGEELLYEVRWYMLKLGTIKLKMLRVHGQRNSTQHKAVAFIDSDNDLPFVDLHAIDYTEMDSSFFSRSFSFMEKRKDEWFIEHSRKAEDGMGMIIERTTRNSNDSLSRGVTKFDTVSLSSPTYLDGLSVVYYARAHARTTRGLLVPTIVYGKSGTTTFYFNSEPTTEEIGAVDYPIRTVELQGKANFEGIFGFTGDFKGWFSDDEAAVPIKAEMNVLVGKITVELANWKRAGWSPPRGNGD